MVTTQAGFAADAKATGDALKSQNSKIWPVGSIYLSVKATNPGTLFGGTWEQIQGRFLLTAGSGYSAGATGGAASVTSGGSSAANTGGTAITVNQMPSHNHGAIVRDEGSGNYFQIDGSRQRNGSIYAYTTYTGGGQAHNHTMAHTHQVNTMPPYLVVYAWKRIA